MSKITYVTALLDIKRDKLESNSFKRPFQLYLDKISILLNHLQDANLVVYIHPDNFEYIKNIKSKNIVLKELTCDNLRTTEYYEPIQKIRNTDSWKNQVNWLKESTQASLELYNPLIFQKMHFLDEISKENPFNTEYFLWIDAGIANAQANPATFSDINFEKNLIPKLDKFLFICFPYNNYSEIHGFSKEGISHYVPNEPVDKVARATFFGGQADEISFLTQKYKKIALDSLNRGYMGTEESIYTLLSYLYKDLINIAMTGQNGLIRGFLDTLTANNSKEWDGKGAFNYKGGRAQQNPKILSIFPEFFKNNPDIDLVIELGTGGGGLALLLAEETEKIGAKFITYDKGNRHPSKLLELADFRNKDLYTPETINEIKELIKLHKKTLVLCDGGNKVQEFITYSDALKVGDIIMAHDYAPNREYFESHIKNKIWNWLEIQDNDIQSSIDINGLETYFPEFQEAAWTCKIKTKGNRTDLYVLTYNAPEQFSFLCESIIKSSPEMFENSDKYVVNNSLDESTFEKYSKLFKKYNFTEFKKDNIGICGGRQFIAEHFNTTPNEYMFFFEDDMSMNPPEDINTVCKNGFSKYHPNFYKTMLKIVNKEKFDFLKWTFTEFFGDNQKQWAWYNVPQEFRNKHWPDYNKLPEHGHDPNSPHTNFKNIKSIDGVPYATGEVYYCNWPQTVSKQGNQKMFLDTTWKHPYEQTWMSHIFKRTIKGEINPGILLMSPITHDRFKHYTPDERREN